MCECNCTCKSPFKVGDLVVIIKSSMKERIGTVARVTSSLLPLRIDSRSGWFGVLLNGTPGHTLSLQSAGSEEVGYPPEYLAPLKNYEFLIKEASIEAETRGRLQGRNEIKRQLRDLIGARPS